jgi:hypothetical protein
MGSLYIWDKFLFQLPSSIPNFQSQTCIPISLVFVATEHTHTHICVHIWTSVDKSPILHIHELWYIWPKSYIFYGLNLLSQRMKNHNILMAVLLKSFYDDVVLMTIMNNEYDNSAISVFNISCTVIYCTFLQILYSENSLLKSLNL